MFSHRRSSLSPLLLRLAIVDATASYSFTSRHASIQSHPQRPPAFFVPVGLLKQAKLHTALPIANDEVGLGMIAIGCGTRKGHAWGMWLTFGLCIAVSYELWDDLELWKG
ncbi:hypothetical protein COLO4_19813 [Corchorus olitorius]|uniref:Uncharacterized protein n=1 Tax=Corchorus olitorius TaxID=93759 RepID=A0A1R3J385_9ROSI|nr:hypothetical protein COLO4_19813 [Corchorus olitorius]